MRSSTFGEGKNAYRIFVEIGQRNTPTGKPRERERERWNNNNETDLININCKEGESTHSEHNSVAHFSGRGNEHISVISFIS